MLTTMKRTVNERVKELRTFFNLTQQDFAELCDLTNTSLSRIENGEVAPQTGTLNKIISKTGVNREWLLEGKGTLIPAGKKELKIVSESAGPNPWKDEAYNEVKSKNAFLQKEVDRLWQMVQHLTGGKAANFLKPFWQAPVKSGQKAA